MGEGWEFKSIMHHVDVLLLLSLLLVTEGGKREAWWMNDTLTPSNQIYDNLWCMVCRGDMDWLISTFRHGWIKATENAQQLLSQERRQPIRIPSTVISFITTPRSVQHSAYLLYIIDIPEIFIQWQWFGHLFHLIGRGMCLSWDFLFSLWMPPGLQNDAGLGLVARCLSLAAMYTHNILISYLLVHEGFC